MTVKKYGEEDIDPSNRKEYDQLTGIFSPDILESSYPSSKRMLRRFSPSINKHMAKLIYDHLRAEKKFKETNPSSTES